MNSGFHRTLVRIPAATGPGRAHRTAGSPSDHTKTGAAAARAAAPLPAAARAAAPLPAAARAAAPLPAAATSSRCSRRGIAGTTAQERCCAGTLVSSNAGTTSRIFKILLG